ncbi:MAG: hypothetical protein LBP56_07640 [Odoribacteraceae bacterium]|jgi:hypothetical protein|nr:hypothetical protein [Odoribacteraceae bacterium]
MANKENGAARPPEGPGAAVPGQGATAAATVSASTVVKIGKGILRGNPAMTAVYMTADGSGFYEESDARNHAATLKDGTVTEVKR